MNIKMMGRFIAQIIAIEAAFMIPALFISLGYGEWPGVKAFGITIGIMILLAAGMFLLCRKAGRLFGAREGFVCVALSWIVMSLLGALPLVLCGQVPRYIDALFEIVSGFTTTGASVIADVEGLYRGILYWRSFTHWVGGMGVLVFLLAVLPTGNGAGFTMHLLRAESPGPDVGKLVPKMRQTALILYCIYIVLTIINFIFLLSGKMHWLHALCTAFGTAGTGGFGTLNTSLAEVSPYIQNVTTVFMFLFGINFSCFYLLLLGKLRSILKDEELRLYVCLAIACVVSLVLAIRPLYGTLEETIRHAAFQVSSIMTTTGFSTTDFDLWPSFAKGILLLLMVVGACAGSTGGGLKCIRVLLLFKVLGRNIRQILNPRNVLVVRSNGKVVDEKVLSNTNAYFAAYMIILVLGTLILSLDGFSVETNLSAALATFNNIGPGLGAVGPTCNFAAYSDLSKVTMCLMMLAGRLEIFPLLVLFSRSTWTRK
ncbi:MAG: TrkH family potassium uptake protein [Oscillospiraceae bacterium]|nr:TrkH family potassium uptake protein [Oscillospiraceae bacterium]